MSYIELIYNEIKRFYQLFNCDILQYADPVADLLDRWGVFRARLFRESCVFHRGNYVKDLNKLGRDLQQIIIVDNSPASYIFHPDNAVRYKNILIKLNKIYMSHRFYLNKMRHQTKHGSNMRLKRLIIDIILFFCRFQWRLGSMT